MVTGGWFRSGVGRMRAFVVGAGVGTMQTPIEVLQDPPQQPTNPGAPALHGMPIAAKHVEALQDRTQGQCETLHTIYKMSSRK